MGIYLHIPFCRQACSYCDFHFSTNLKRKEEMRAAIIQEMQLRRGFLAGEQIETLYFGGGTPSVYAPNALAELIAAAETYLGIEASKLREITLEANPEDLTAAYLQSLWDETPIRRLSVGVQSFRDQDLGAINRKHSAQQVLGCIQKAQDIGFQNISIDLIFGLPKMGLADWEQNVRRALQLGIQHISLYALTVEEKTQLAFQVRKQRLRLPEEAQYEAQFLLAHELLSAAGFEHYELSNYAKAGFRAVHNANYWKNQPYLGLGPAAHSYAANKRYANVANNEMYMQRIAAGEMPYHFEEELGEKELLNEYIMTRLRIAEGIEKAWIVAHYGSETLRGLLEYARNTDYFEETDTHLSIKPQHWLISDSLIADMFVE